MCIKDNDDFKIVLEHYPRVALAIELHWGDRDFDKVMDKFLHDTRDGTRQGFPDPVGGALLRLSLLHVQLFPPNDKDIWRDAYTPR